MEAIVDYLKRRLIEVGSPRWEAIAAECGIAKTLPRKIAYGDRENPGVQTVQPLLSFFQEVDRGERDLPVVCGVAEPTARPKHKAEA